MLAQHSSSREWTVRCLVMWPNLKIQLPLANGALIGVEDS
jgi:hypothetical protein